MHVISLMNQKGGVGKTSTTMHVAGALSVAGQRVLLVDFDPQSSLTQGFLGPVLTEDLDPATTTAAIFEGGLPMPGDLIRPTDFDRIDLLPGSRASTRFNIPEPDLASADLQFCLRDFLDVVRRDGAYDLVLIDCPPNLHLASWAALVASDGLVVPVQPEDYGAQGLRDVQRSLALVQSGPNPDVVLLGYLLTMVGKGEIQRTIAESLRAEYGDDIFGAPFPFAVEFKEAVSFRRPMSHYKGKTAKAKAVAAIAAELLARAAERIAPEPALKEVA